MPLVPINVLNFNPAESIKFLAGDYAFEIVKCEQTTSKEKGTPMLAVQSKVLRGPGTSSQFNDKTVYSNYMLTDKGGPFLRRLCDAVGLTGHIAQAGGQFDESWFLGRQYAARVQIKNDRPNIVDERGVNDPMPTGPAMPGAATPSQFQNVANQALPQVPPASMAPPPPVNAPPMQYAAPPQGYAPPPPQNYAAAAPPPAAPLPPAGYAAPPPPPSQLGQK